MTKRPYRFRRLRLVLVTVALLGVVLFALFVGVPTLRVMYAKPSVPADYRAALRDARLEDMQVDPAVAGEAWDELCVALAQTPLLINQFELERRATGDYDFVLIDAIYVFPGIDPALHEREREVLDKLEASGVVDAVRRCVDRPLAQRHADAPDRAITLDPLPELDQASKYVRTRRAAMRLAVASGDDETAAAIFDELLGVAETLANQPLYIDRAFAVSAADHAVAELQQELGEHAFGETACLRLLETLTTRRFPPLAVAIEGERARILDIVERIFSVDAAGDGYLVPSAGSAVFGGTEQRVRLGDIVPAFRSRFVWAGRRETLDLVNGFFDAAVERANLAPPARPDPPFAPDELARLARDAELVFVNLPVLDPFFAADACLATDLIGARIAVGVELYVARTGQMPETLDDLVPSILPGLPIDPSTGGPFRYRRVDDQRYLLYGDGRDGVDDGGTFDRAAPRTGATPGTDMLLAPLPRGAPADDAG